MQQNVSEKDNPPAVRMIALDLDGTALLSDHAHISRRLRRTLQRAVARGIRVVPVTGRIYSVLPKDVTSVPGIEYAVTSYGAVIYALKERRTLFSACIPRQDAEWILRLARRENCYVEAWSRGRIFVPDDQFRRIETLPFSPLHSDVLRKIGTAAGGSADFWAKHGETVEKINFPLLPPAQKATMLGKLAQCPRLFFVPMQSGFEIVRAGATKADGLANFCRLLQQKGVSVGMRNILAIGDSEGDAEMIRKAGIGVAMGNASRALKKLADAVTLDNERDGAAAAIERYALSGCA